MQQLEERDTYTPTDIPHVRGNCGSAWVTDPSMMKPDIEEVHYMVHFF